MGEPRLVNIILFVLTLTIVPLVLAASIHRVFPSLLPTLRAFIHRELPGFWFCVTIIAIVWVLLLAMKAAEDGWGALIAAFFLVYIPFMYGRLTQYERDREHLKALQPGLDKLIAGLGPGGKQFKEG